MVSSITSSFSLSTNVFHSFSLRPLLLFGGLRTIRFRCVYYSLHMYITIVGQQQGELTNFDLGSLNDSFVAGGNT